MVVELCIVVYTPVSIGTRKIVSSWFRNKGGKTMHFYLYHEAGLRGSDKYTQNFMAACFAENCILTRGHYWAKNILKMDRLMTAINY